MKKLVAVCFVITMMVAFSTGQVFATKPGQDVNPNGFPSGEHFNLNIIGKKAHFTCPAQDYYLRVTSCGCGNNHTIGDLVESCDPSDTCEETTIPIYGNVIFVPENGEGIEIFMRSGRASGKGKKSEALPYVLQVIDPCTAAFDGDAAILQLPKNEGGYDVYARALAKPTDNPNIIITPGLYAAEDEYGNALLFLGQVTADGFRTPSQELIRRKGKSKAVEITGLFEWTGTVCYLDPSDIPAGGDYYDHQVCAIDDDGDGLYDRYIERDWDTYPDTGCPADSTPVTVYCHAYSEEWVFSIGDFVEYLWDVDNNGVKLLQVRFYPNNGEPGLLAPGRPKTPDLRNTNLTTTWGDIKSGG